MNVFQTAIYFAGIIGSATLLVTTEKSLSKFITSLQIISVGLALLPFDLDSIGMIGFFISTILMIIYARHQKELMTGQIGCIYGVAIPVGIGILFKFESWPLGGEVGLLMLIPIITLTIATINYRNLKNEFGFFILPGIFAVFDFVGYWTE